MNFDHFKQRYLEYTLGRVQRALSSLQVCDSVRINLPETYRSAAYDAALNLGIHIRTTRPFRRKGYSNFLYIVHYP